MKTALRARIATGAALAALALALTWWSPTWLFAALALALMLAALPEWKRLAPPTSTATLAGVMAAAAAGATGLFLAPRGLLPACLGGVLLWAWLTADLALDRAERPPHNHSSGLLSLIQGGCIVLVAWCALLLMRLEQGAAVTIAMLLVICSADIFAFFSGKALGKRQLAPNISPGKTVEGAIGGMLCALALAAALAFFALDLSAGRALAWLLASAAAAGAGVVGDLFESRLKRRAGVKDSGALLPGHGGLLDRIDGLLAAAPVFAVVWTISS